MSPLFNQKRGKGLVIWGSWGALGAFMRPEFGLRDFIQANKAVFCE